MSFNRSTLLMTRNAGTPASSINASAFSSASPSASSVMKRARSAPAQAAFTSSRRKRPSFVAGRSRPGVSKKAACASSVFNTPSNLRLVVPGFRVTMASFSPKMRLSRVDLPTFGRPMIAMKPERNPSGVSWRASPLLKILSRSSVRGSSRVRGALFFRDTSATYRKVPSMPSSRSWRRSTEAGAPVIRQVVFWVLGNAMTSRMEGAPVSSIMMRSRPNAIPP